jgi:hypothetical protein
MVKSKRYSFSGVEEMIGNPDYKNFKGGRIEVYDKKDKSGYACYEARFLIPIEFMDSFRETWDLKESDEMDFDSMINLRPAQNTSREVLDPNIRQQVESITRSLLQDSK